MAPCGFTIQLETDHLGPLHICEKLDNSSHGWFNF